MSAMVDVTRRRLGFVLLRAVMRRGLLLGALWWALSGGDRSGAVLGLVAVAIATIASVVLSVPVEMTVSPRGLCVLAWAFVVGSVRGGWDVAWRALSPRLPLDPRIVHHPTHLAPGTQRRVFGCVNSLMPGTLSIDSSGDDLLIHVLVDRGDAQHRDFDALADYVAQALQAPRGETSDR